MPDHYGATLRFWPWVPDRPPVRAVGDWLRSEFGEIVHAGSNGGPINAPTLYPGGVLELEAEELCEGVEEFIEPRLDLEETPSVLAALRAGGVSFVARDTGCDDKPGREISWKPGLERERERAVSPNGSITLPAPVASSLLADMPFEQAHARIKNYFAPLEEYVEDPLDARCSCPDCGAEGQLRVEYRYDLLGLGRDGVPILSAGELTEVLCMACLSDHDRLPPPPAVDG
jgi:hypothetical protein